MKPVRYRFDDYVLDAAARELQRGDQRIAIPPKSLECLAYLLQHNGRAVGRDELIAAVWGRVDASDTLLTQTIWRARRAIGDDGDDGDQSLRTVPRFGYRWVAPVRVEPVAAEGGLAMPAGGIDVPHPAAVSADAEAPARVAQIPRRGVGSTRQWLAVSGVALVAFIVFAGLAWRRSTQTSPPSGPVRSLVVVLPVNMAGSSSETTWIRLGAMDYVASRLREARLNVLPSERVVAISKATAGAAGPDAKERDRLAGLTNADYLLVPRAAFADGTWQFSIDAYRGGRARTYRAEAALPLPAANLAVARFLADSGHPSTFDQSPPDEINEIAQRIDAATLEGDLGKARDLLDHVSADLRADPRLRVRDGRVAFRAGKLEAAEAAFTPLVADNADVPVAIRALGEMGLGGVAIRRHRFEDAERHYSAALAALGPAGDMNLRGRAFTERAVVQGSLGRVDLAVADIGRARNELERSGDPLGLASLDLNGALIENQRGHYADANAMFDRATDVFARFDIADQLAIALAGKVDTQMTVLDHAGAVQSSMRAWNLLPRLEDRLLIEFMATRHVQALRANGRLAEAARVLDRFGATGDHPSADPVFGVLRAAVLIDQGKAPLALRLADSILHDFEQAPAGSCSDTVPQAAIVLTEAALQSRNVDAAAPLLARLSEFAASPQDPEWTFADELTRGELLAARGDPAADRHFAAALSFADGAREPARTVIAGAAYANYAAARGDRPRAEALLDRLKPYAALDYRAARAASLLHSFLGESAPADAAGVQARALAGERTSGNP